METAQQKQALKFNSFDWGWLVISFGMALGAGIVLVPVSVGVVGLVAFLWVALWAYPAIYLFQKLYMNTLFENDTAKCYSDTIADLIGKKWGSLLGILYFIMMAIWTIIYGMLVCSSIAHYLYQFHIVSDPNLLSNAFFTLVVMSVLVFIGCKSEKLLFKISGVVSVLLLACVLLAAIMVLPYWKFSNVTYIPQGIKFVTSTTVMFPFALTTILFIQSLSPMVMSYRTKYADRQFAQKKAISTMRLALFILATIVLFYIIAFAGIISQNEAILAKNQNESVFMIIQKMNYSNPLINVLGIFINICAVLAAFLSIITGMREGVRGILLNLIRGIGKDGAIVKSPVFEVIIGVIIVLMTWLSIVFQVPIYKLVPLCGPIFGIIGCLMPAFLVYKVPALYKYKGLTVYYIVYVGLILCISPLLMKAM
ncbi:MAG: hypothetical protein K2Y14_13860 [Burkholderiales bacterium]|nr:hypothetical protein [Burkholderiales bacterium]